MYPSLCSSQNYLYSNTTQVSSCCFDINSGSQVKQWSHRFDNMWPSAGLTNLKEWHHILGHCCSLWVVLGEVCVTQRKKEAGWSGLNKALNFPLMISFMLLDDSYIWFLVWWDTLSVSVCLLTETDKMQISLSYLNLWIKCLGKRSDTISSMFISCSL